MPYHVLYLRKVCPLRSQCCRVPRAGQTIRATRPNAFRELRCSVLLTYRLAPPTKGRPNGNGSRELTCDDSCRLRPGDQPNEDHLQARKNVRLLPRTIERVSRADQRTVKRGLFRQSDKGSLPMLNEPHIPGVSVEE